MLKIDNVAVLGTGVMGAQIAAHCANAGLKVLAFDMDQDIAENGIKKATSIKPKAFYDRKDISLIESCNYNDHLEKLKECDWVIEVIAERLDWKKDLYKKIAPYIEGKIVTSNTSGISLSELTEDMDDNFKENFFITHFFNPPRYMKLVEFIYSELNNEDLISGMAQFMEDKLGKGVVYAKDTPNFIANRIGVFGMMVTVNEAINRKINIEDVDALTGPIIGRPKSATFRTADVVGLDVMQFVANTAYNKCENDKYRDQYVIPEKVKYLIDNECLGQKSGAGFYKKIDKGIIHVFDFDSMDYRPINKKRFKAIALAKEQNTLQGKLKAAVFCDDDAGDFLWALTSQSLIYCAELLGEIADDIINIDNALSWGFAWEKGPFKTWDMLGFNDVISKMKASDLKVPDWVLEMQSKGFSSFYKQEDGEYYHYDLVSKDYKKINLRNDQITFASFIQKNKTIKKNWSASMIDLDDGVLGVELHSILKPDFNPLDGSIVSTLDSAVKWVSDNNYKGIVISGDGPNFSAGANLNLILNAAYRKEWDLIDKMTKTMQDTFQSLRFAPFPVVAAPFGFVLGGGYEICGSCDRIVASAESYIGLVEVGMGIIPGAGGNLRMLSNVSDNIKTMMPGSFPIVQKVFETVGFAKVATSAKEAKKFSYLRKNDKFILNRSVLLHEAKNEVLTMSNDYKTPEMRSFKLPGASGRLVVDTSIKGFVKSKKISEHDAVVGRKLAYVLTGGEKGGPFSPVDEQYLLDIEREAFISLCGEQKTIERIDYFLKKGKPLRN
ncbi:3-hydroxyacyl-CoA dehydrogenase/enoyl-CoA hydratase family protein [bacterium]|nr:3-hydroxyacyl-CoA dehydrogenase/enoyl-CoA hydratase family protein [bacterium]